MITIKEYTAPSSIDEAYHLLTSKKNATLVGGGAFIRMGAKNISLAIDLSKANLNYIKEDDKNIILGGMTTFRDIERSPLLASHFHNILAQSVKDIVGVQLRNIITVGGTVYSRYGFSDLITALLALDTKVKLYHQGLVPLAQFLEVGSSRPDILESIMIAKDNRKAAFKAIRNSKGDYAILNMAISTVEDKFRISVGARPNRAVLACKTMAYLNQSGLSEEHISEACRIITNEIRFGTNTRGSREYRQKICSVLLKRLLMEVVSHEN